MPGLPPVGERTLRAVYERVLAASPDEIAQVDESGAVTFAESYHRCLQLAAGIAAHGIGHQEPAALLLDNSLDAVHVWSGIGLGGRVEVPVNTAYKGRFLTHVLNDSGAGLIVIEDGYADRLAEVAGDLTALRTVVVRGDPGRAAALSRRFRVLPLAELETHGEAAPAPGDAGELVAYMYTSGTTGVSKGVLISHAHAYTYASREHLDRPRAGDRIAVVLPLFHLAGQWYGVYQGLIHKVRCYVAPGFSVSRYWDMVREQGITFTVTLGAMAELLQQQPPRPDDADNPLQIAVMAPLASDVRGFSERFGLRAAAVYGMSEIGAVLDGPPETIVGGEAGFARPGYELRLVDASGRDVEPGQIGELWVKPEDPRMVMGENISSFEVERVINEHPAVFESAVVGVPSELSEDEIKAVIVPRDGQQIDPVELTTFLTGRLPYFMVPRYLEFAAGLPKTPTQKMRKHLLRDTGTGPQTWDREAAGIVLRRGSR